MDPRLEDYIEAHIDPDPEELAHIDRLTNLRLLNGRMCSGHIQGRMLKMLATMIGPMRVLELGTFSGYSALSLAEGLPPGATLDTVEVDDELRDFIQANLDSSPHGAKVTLHIGDASAMAAKWTDGEFDLIFMDADKRRYADMYRLYLPKLKRGGYMIADNTLWDAHVVEQGRHSPQTRGIMEFNDLVAADPAVEKCILPLRDGLTLIRRL